MIAASAAGSAAGGAGGLADARALMRAAVREAMAPRRRLEMDEWADEHRWIAQKAGAHPGRWRTSFAEYLREPMRCLSGDRYNEVTLMWGSQLGKTELYTNAIGYFLDVDPGPMLVVMPNAELARAYNTERLIPSIKASPAMLRHLTTAPRDVKGMQIEFDATVLHVVGSNAQSHLEMRSKRYVFLDETDNEGFGEQAADYARERTKAFRDLLGGLGRAKVLNASKPSYANTNIHRKFLAGDQRTYWVPCPACGAYQVLRWALVRWNGGVLADPDEVERSTWYECEHCRARIENAQKPAMLRAGRWARKGERVERDGAVVGEPERPVTRHASFQLSSLYSPVLAFGWVAKRFVQSGGQTRVWVNGELGEPYSENGNKVEADEARFACLAVEAGGYRMVRPWSGVAGGPRVPGPVVCLVGGIDLQIDRAVVQVTGFSAGGLDPYLIWYDVVELGGGLAALNRLVSGGLLFEWDRPAQPGQAPMGPQLMPVELWGIDSGEGRRTVDVYQWVQRWPHVWATKGADALQFGAPWDKKLLRYDPAAPAGVAPSKSDPARMTESVRFLRINATAWKERVLGGLKRRIEEVRGGRTGRPLTPAGSAAAAAAGGAQERQGRSWLPADTDDGYIKQLTAEQQVPVLSRDGRTRAFVFQLRPGFRDNHFLDTTVICWALADAMNVRARTRPRLVPVPGQAGAPAAGPVETPGPVARGRSAPNLGASIERFLTR